MDYKALKSYQIAFELAMRVFEISKKLPKKEAYSLTDQIRRSSRTVCSNIAEAYRKRNYPNHFKSKLSDSDSENAETQTWLHFASQCGYVTKVEYEELNKKVKKLENF